MRSGMLYRFAAGVVLFALACACQAGMAVPLSNAEMDVFQSGFAVDWTPYTTGAAVPAGLQFFPDSRNFRTAPYSQGILGIDIPGQPGGTFGAGLARQVPAVPGRVYLFVGFQDLFDEWYAPPPGRRFAHFFGIEPHGDLDPPEPFRTGSVRWLAEGQWFFNDMPGNSTQVGGMHRCTASWPARSDAISLWTGVHVYADGPVSPHPTVFDIDSHALFEFENPARAQLENAGFELALNLTPELGPDDLHRIVIPDRWVPIGGGIGQNDSYFTDSASARSGARGTRIYNKRGTLTRGLMQRASTPPGAWSAVFAAWVRSNPSSGAVAAVGIDPEGGDDINSPAVIWTPNTGPDNSWVPLSVSAPCSGPSVTVFVCLRNAGANTGVTCWADFDDASLVFDADQTPPEPFAVIAESPTTLLGFISARIEPEPVDPETGIASVQYAIGTTPGGTETAPFTECEDRALILARGLNLSPGATYYVTVRAVNGAGMERTATSGPVLCLPQPYEYSWSGPQHLSQTNFSADNPRLAVGPEGRMCAVWREYADSEWDGARSIVVLRTRSGAVWNSPVRASGAPKAWWPDAAITPSGPVVSYAAPGGPAGNELRAVFQNGSGEFFEQLIASDVSAFPRIVWTQSSGLVAACVRAQPGYPESGQPSLVVEQPFWQTVPLFPQGSAGPQTRVRAAAAGPDIHCLFGISDGPDPGLYYRRRNAGGEITGAMLVARGVGAGEIAAAADGTVAAVYVLDGDVWFTAGSDDGSGGLLFEPPVCLGRGKHPRIAFGPDNRAHVIMFADTGAFNISGAPLVVPIHLYRGPQGWSMPSAVCGPSATSGIWAQEPGDLAVDSEGNLHFVWSNNPQDPGWTNGVFEGYYWIDYHTTGPMDPVGSDIAAAKLWGDDIAAGKGYPAGKVVQLSSKQVTAVGAFPFEAAAGASTVTRSIPCFYIQESDRSSGIRVIAGPATDNPAPQIGVSPGDLVTVSGVLSTINGERTIGYLTAEGQPRGVTYAVTGSGPPPAPLFMRVSNLGGGGLGPTSGAADGAGANNVGLLVRVAGRVLATDTDPRGVRVLYVDDGSGPPCGPARGFKLYDTAATAQVGDLIVVDGGSSVEVLDASSQNSGDETVIRVVMPRAAASVAQTPENR